MIGNRIPTLQWFTYHFREAELKALESGQELAELEANIREDLLDNRKEQS